MRKIRVIYSVFFSICMVIGILSISHVVASTFELKFSGDLYHRILDGSANNKYYAFYENKSLTVSGTATVTVDPDNLLPKGDKGNRTYAYCYYGDPSGKGTKICNTSFVVNRADKCKSFSMSGTTKKAGPKYYLYFYKIQDDYIDLHLEGTLKSNN